MELNKIYNEDCLNALAKIPDNSIDCIITDPPYGTQTTFRDGWMVGERSNVKIHPHRLRVTRITSLLNKGMPLQKVANFAGHNDPSTTMGYWRADNEDIHYEYNKYSN